MRSCRLVRLFIALLAAPLALAAWATPAPAAQVTRITYDVVGGTFGSGSQFPGEPIVGGSVVIIPLATISTPFSTSAGAARVRLSLVGALSGTIPFLRVTPAYDVLSPLRASLTSGLATLGCNTGGAGTCEAQIRSGLLTPFGSFPRSLRTRTAALISGTYIPGSVSQMSIQALTQTTVYTHTPFSGFLPVTTSVATAAAAFQIGNEVRTTVPEPSNGTLVGLGLLGLAGFGGLGARVRRRRDAQSE